MNHATLDEARAAKAEALAMYREQAAVVGVGITRIEGGYGVKVNLREPAPPGAELPSSINGVPIRVDVVAHIQER